ncbi:Pentatricopeptide repeat-containing protein [Capsicum annuum]|uniref:Pentatricopeptide repeat-containing protein n=1 Tax=Capsicum annuum TaxID=4072 RepID=A0A1U8GNF2_CAPAN|nr:pentatricopeptide repeat-containing protein At3g26540 [Capsicum annuum]XP_016569634.1 pentatricopeptide repeat-containing protein At3g26540 [Capsicum annuum]XP_016569635.1 pentatricopeptide repeat-containing protein At3g26540 [Capsicum annuum]KAF3679257.1 Pentatricopeptide repeat-containing protein [Capsicum annuum]KAF3681308.1 Pentatricopeptide repeat-containing protein [Capsicum annuum]PHT83806.1 Pentatricopeptide repeat-containing protein [Capsicum annuum]
MGINAASVLNHIINGEPTTPKLPILSSESKALTATIINHLRLGRLGKAISVLFSAPVPFPFALYAHLFRICASQKAIVEVRKVESHLVSFAPTPPVFLLNRAIEAYGKCGCLVDARELFDEMPQRDGGSWNAMITAYSQNGYAKKALGVFSDMHKSGVFAAEVTFAGVLASCASSLAFWVSRQVHALILKYGLGGNVILGSSLVDVYGKCRSMGDARRMFDEIERPNAVTWNVIVRRYLEMGNGKESVFLFSKMISLNARPMTFTVSNALIACTCFGGFCEGIQIHGFIIKINYEEDELVSCSLIDVYAKCEDLACARTIFDLLSPKNLIHWTSMVSGYAMSRKTRQARDLFDRMPERNIVSWNAMLAGYAHNLQWDEAMELIILMCNDTRDIDRVTVSLILNVSARLSDVELGKQVHGYMYRHGFYSDLGVANALLDMYGKCGNLRKARAWFYEMSHFRDMVSWNALLSSYARHRMSEEALVIFWEMLGEATPSKFTFATLLAVCANIFAREQGKQIHGFMIRNGYDLDIVIRGSLVDMYSKCRCLDCALNVFIGTPVKDVVLWNSLLLGCYYNKQSEALLKLFEAMMEDGVKPDSTTLRAVLLACISQGYVKLGGQYFNSLSHDYFIIPQPEHYESMIKLYGLHGFFDELEDFVKKMPFQPTVPMLTRVFDSSKAHNNTRLGKWAVRHLNLLKD